MTIKELAGILNEMVRDGLGDMEVHFTDTYTQSEGWEVEDDTATLQVDKAVLENGKVVLESE